jgi:hypothetical protein
MTQTMLSNRTSATAGYSFWAAVVLAVIAAVAAALLRLYPLEWNFVPMGALALFAGARLGSWKWVLLPLSLVVATDYLLSLARPGYPFLYPEVPFVYASYVLVFALGRLLQNTANVLPLVGTTFLGSVVFFLITNFAVWFDVAIL